MAYSFCKVCERNTLHLLANSCAEHSDWPQEIKPRTVIDVMIPAYSASEETNKFTVSKKAEGKDTRGVSFKSGSDINALLGLEPAPFRGPGEFCTYCGDGPLTELGVGGPAYTKGIANPSKLIGTEIIYDEKTGKPVSFKDKVIHLNQKVTACPKCCLNIKPIMRKLRDRDGNIIGEEIVTQAVKFPDFD